MNNITNKNQELINENNLLKEQLSPEATRTRNAKMNQTYYHDTINNLKQQLKIAQAQAANANALKDKCESSLAKLIKNNSNLKSQLNQQTKNVNSVKKSSAQQKIKLVNYQEQMQV